MASMATSLLKCHSSFIMLDAAYCKDLHSNTKKPGSPPPTYHPNKNSGQVYRQHNEKGAGIQQTTINRRFSVAGSIKAKIRDVEIVFDFSLRQWPPTESVITVQAMASIFNGYLPFEVSLIIHHAGCSILQGLTPQHKE
eukprot:scaffold46974_cov39-Cyclotella_meneghiniana.AAC.2